MARFKPKPVVSAFVPPVRQFVDLELHGQTYQLCYDFESIAWAEDFAKCDLLDAFTGSFFHDPVTGDLKVTKLPGARVLAGLFFASIHVAHPEITFEDSMRLIAFDARVDIFVEIVKAWFVSHRSPTAPADETSVAPGEEAGS